MENKTYNVGFYERLSRDDLVKQGNSASIKNQHDYLLGYLKKHSDLNLVDEYIDDGYSGANFDRPGFKRMIVDIKKGKINCVITKDLSRFGRNAGQADYYLRNVFIDYNVRYIAIDDEFDSFINGYDDERVEFKQFYNGMSPIEASKKVKSIIYNKKREGKFLGGIAPYGYNKDPEDKYHLVIDETSSKVVKRMFKMFIDGYSLREIAKTFSNEGIPTPSIYKGLNRGKRSAAFELWDTRTIDEMLKNPTYIGNLTQCRRKKVSCRSKKIVRTNPDDWIIVENTHEPIVSKEEFQLVQEIYKKNKHVRKNGRYHHLLAGFLYCKECGHRIAIAKRSNGKFYCKCSFYSKYSTFGVCTSHSMNYQLLEDQVVNEVKKAIEQYVDRYQTEQELIKSKKTISLVEKIDKDITKAKIQIKNNETKIERMYMDKLDGVVTSEVYVNVYNKIQMENKILEDSILELETQKQKIKTEDNYLEEYKKMVETFFKANTIDRNLLCQIIDKIEIDANRNVDIYYKIRLT